MINLNGKTSDAARGLEFRVRIIEVLRMAWTRPRNSRKRKSQERRVRLGVADFDSVKIDGAACMVFPAYEERGDCWAYSELVLAGCARWELPLCRHPDFLVEREPGQGEIFESSNHLLWLTPSCLLQLEGELAHAVFAGRHGEVVGEPHDVLRNFVFDYTLEMLNTEYGHHLEGERGRLLIDVLTEETARRDFQQASLAVIEEVASRVSVRLSGE